MSSTKRRRVLGVAARVVGSILGTVIWWAATDGGIDPVEVVTRLALLLVDIPAGGRRRDGRCRRRRDRARPSRAGHRS